MNHYYRTESRDRSHASSTASVDAVTSPIMVTIARSDALAALADGGDLVVVIASSRLIENDVADRDERSSTGWFDRRDLDDPVDDGDPFDDLPF